MHALGIAGHFGADHAGRVIVVLCTTHPPYGAVVEKLDFECAS